MWIQHDMALHEKLKRARTLLIKYARGGISACRLSPML